MGKALSIGLIFLSLGLSFGPLIYGFASHGWNYKALVTPEPNPLEGVETNRMGAELIDFTTSNVRLEISSPITFAPIRIDNITAKIYSSIQTDKELGSISLQEATSISPGSSKVIVLDIIFLDEAYLQNNNENRVDIKNLSITIYGIKITGETIKNVEISVS
ncbi:hypothetical protein AKJ45_01465 [candidate division MSBL1 archaeon SCGC-AAA261F19]|uniref:Uncharacterized protein n=2 Tax=candidate division MSBL1 TaxID=215777 RepID=A0A133VAJ9_9EURY|nr:hypothetical protein AKJ43_00805 [candidate division MSBL1 archaeon SCGC-AAA261D19]KXB03473.1 hypothetical protein AKJ45_01465 [candidate division MSBL1 archaeon SCGC-AAA261F19]